MSEVSEQISHKMASNNPLEQFVLLAKGCRGAGLLELIKQVLETPGIHVFGEFLHMPQIAEVCYIVGHHSPSIKSCKFLFPIPIQWNYFCPLLS